uniref:HECT domain-containing protein n=1 Tax=Clytia hemisphaerica TaxID=252671 RepID=A0A7M5XI47_9CNID|eukprot:TCONS_00040299-protein
MFPALDALKIMSTMNKHKNFDDTVDALNTFSLDPSSVSTGAEVITIYTQQVTTKDELLTVKRENLWKDAMRFYKIASARKSMLFNKFRVDFDGEVGVDAGSLSIEFFTKFFEQARSELFEMVPSGIYLIPKRSGGNLTSFKIFGMAMAHSLMHGGPPFPYLHLWCYLMLLDKSDDEIAACLFESYENLIPLNAGSSTVIQFLNKLSICKSNDEIQAILDSAEGPAFEQIINSSQWDINVEVNINNIETLKSIILWEELVTKREKQIKAMREGMEILGFLPFLQNYEYLLREFFVGNTKELTPEVLSQIILWDDAENPDHPAYPTLHQ